MLLSFPFSQHVNFGLTHLMLAAKSACLGWMLFLLFFCGGGGLFWIRHCYIARKVAGFGFLLKPDLSYCGGFQGYRRRWVNWFWFIRSFEGRLSRSSVEPHFLGIMLTKLSGICWSEMFKKSLKKMKTVYSDASCCWTGCFWGNENNCLRFSSRLEHFYVIQLTLEISKYFQVILLGITYSLWQSLLLSLVFHSTVFSWELLC